MLYSENPDWKDVVPVSQDDGPNPLVPIAYAEDYIIDMNPAHYTVWNYRQNVLFALQSDLNAELEFIDMIAGDQAKNYQVWHHRQVIVDKLGAGDQELGFINTILETDSKNYHGWSYRQWVVKRFDLWKDELAFTNDLILLDVRNNSAWNYRYYVLFENPQKPSTETVEKEIDLLEKSDKTLDTMEPLLKELIDIQVESPFIVSAYIDIYEQRAKQSKSPIDPVVFEMCDEMIKKLDIIREKYWEFRKTKLSQL
ncbi:hypothetical protein BY458DRAFT_446694 [Sporodiniella umbellata]|nr:hypothetical protein BY458DRAFT_446694 [Sporodiniella umbellata]